MPTEVNDAQVEKEE
jgi:hypothetical protein